MKKRLNYMVARKIVMSINKQADFVEFVATLLGKKLTLEENYIGVQRVRTSARNTFNLCRR